METRSIGLIIFLLLVGGMAVLLFAPTISLPSLTGKTRETRTFFDINFDGKIQGTFSGSFEDEVEPVMPNATIKEGYFNGSIELDGETKTFVGQIIGGTFNGRVFDGTITHGTDWDGRIDGFVYRAELDGREVIAVVGEVAVNPLLSWTIIIILASFGALLTVWFWRKKSEYDYYGSRDWLTEEDKNARRILKETYDYPVTETSASILISEELDESGKSKPREALFGYVSQTGNLSIVRMREGNLVKWFRDVPFATFIDEFEKRGMRQTIDVTRLRNRLQDLRERVPKKERLRGRVDESVVRDEFTDNSV